MNEKRYDSTSAYNLYLKDVIKYDLLTREEEKKLAIRAKKGNAEAKNKLMLSNLRLVISLAKRFSYDGNLDDLIQEGNIGLMKAIEKFEYERGWRLSTYACWWIMQHINRYIQQDSTIRLPIYQMELIRRVNRAVREHVKETGYEPSTEEIALELNEYRNFSGEKVKKLMELYGLSKVFSLDSLLNGQEEDSEKSESFVYHNQLADYKKDSVENDICNKQIIDYIKRMMGHLKSKEQTVLSLRFGLFDGDEKTLHHVGTIFGLTRERIRQIEKKALFRLRNLILRDLGSKRKCIDFLR